MKPTIPTLAPKPTDGYALGPPPQLPAEDRPRQNQSDTQSMQNAKYSTELGTSLWNFLSSWETGDRAAGREWKHCPHEIFFSQCHQRQVCLSRERNSTLDNIMLRLTPI